MFGSGKCVFLRVKRSLTRHEKSPKRDFRTLSYEGKYLRNVDDEIGFDPLGIGVMKQDFKFVGSTWR